MKYEALKVETLETRIHVYCIYDEYAQFDQNFEILIYMS